MTHVWAPLAGVTLSGQYGEASSAGTIVHFAFVDQNRNLVTAKGKLPAGADTWQVVTVLYDPSRPRRNALYPLEGFEVGL